MATTADEDLPATVDSGTPPPGWGTDDRISFSKETGKYVQEDDDGSEMEYNSKLKAWMPVVHSPLAMQLIAGLRR